ncbi:hypothetical protein C8034_v007514 [Colletotrichum sidae]|uniref:Uncharacterized protein n=1 Tax=Colletotrichum sidae TaxID=1347389 RepID=A0A4R8TRF4_9PEZI|nr:hypothetical protein C8034_v007514 [Colletotrichum sidae]
MRYAWDVKRHSDEQPTPPRSAQIRMLWGRSYPFSAGPAPGRCPSCNTSVHYPFTAADPTGLAPVPTQCHKGPAHPSGVERWTSRLHSGDDVHTLIFKTTPGQNRRLSQTAPVTAMCNARGSKSAIIGRSGRVHGIFD